MKFYFLRMNSDEVGTTLKHPETINGNVKNLSIRMKKERKRKCHFYFKNLTLLVITRLNSPSFSSNSTPSQMKNDKKRKFSPHLPAATGRWPIFSIISGNIGKHRDVSFFENIAIFPQRNFVAEKKSRFFAM